MVLRPPYLKNVLVRMCSGIKYTIWVLKADQYLIVRHDDEQYKVFDNAQWRVMMETFPVYGIGDSNMNSEEREQLDDWCYSALSGTKYDAPIIKD